MQSNKSDCVTDHKNIAEIENYLSSIDISLCDPTALESIYNEMKGSENQLVSSQNVTFALERIFSISTSDQCLKFLKAIDLDKMIYKKLSSRAIENILDRFFHLIYVEEVENGLKILEEIFNLFLPNDYKKFIKNENSTHILRKILYLITGKRFNKNNKISQFTHKNTLKFIKKYKKGIEEINLDKIDHFYAWVTLLQYVKLIKSQSFIKNSLKKDLTAKKEAVLFLEGIVEEANEENMKIFIDKILPKIEVKENSFLIQKVLKNSNQPIYKKVDVTTEDKNSNILLAYCFNLIKNSQFDLLRKILKEKLEVENSIFFDLLLRKFSTADHFEIDSKYVEFICEIFNYKEFSDELAVDFVKFFSFYSNGKEKNEDFIGHKNLNSKSGRSLIKAFVFGNFDVSIKQQYFDQNINFFLKNNQWKELRQVMHEVLSFTSGHTKKKAGDILRGISKNTKS